LLIADTGNSRIVRWFAGDKSGVVVAGGEQGSELHQLNRPSSVAIDEVDGSLLIADTRNHRIVRWKKDAQTGELMAGGK